MIKRKTINIIYLLVVLVLAGCQNKVSESQNETAQPTNVQNHEADLPANQLSLKNKVDSSGCVAISPQPSPGPTEPSLFPVVQKTDWIKGSKPAYVTVIEYGDYQCPYSAQLAPIINQLINTFPSDVQLVYRHFPLIEQHNKAALAVQAAETAGLYGKFWEMHDRLFENQNEWSNMSLESFHQWILSAAEELQIDSEQFTIQLDSNEISRIPKEAWEFNRSLGIPFTPFIIINQQIWSDSLPLNFDNLSSIVKLDLLEKKQYSSCPPMKLDVGKKYGAIIHTAKGDITIQLFPGIAPIAVNNFIFLAREGWYDGVSFHRVIENYIAQAGDPSGTGYGSPGYAFKNEISPKLTFDHPGLLAMANAGPDTNGSQFFITMAPAPNLNGNYTIFGEVINGMDVVENLSLRDPASAEPRSPGDIISTIEILEQ
jgi:cyclophilin family peptidyl-prolyl cis-trans isomerase/protein-disulfide isomerase